MSTMEDRMSKVERMLEELVEINREMQEQHRAWQGAEHARREAEHAWQEAEHTRRETDRAQQEVYRAQREADKRAYEQEKRDAQRKWGELANKMGTLVEDIVAPGIPTVFRNLFGFDRLTANAQRVRRTHPTDPGREQEFDYVVAAGDLVLITQTKSTLRSEDIPAFLAALREARDYLPEARDKTIVGALAGFSVEPSLVVAAERRGLLMFGLGTGLLQVLNSPGFQPARF